MIRTTCAALAALALAQPAHAACTFTGDQVAFLQCMNKQLPIAFATIGHDAVIYSGSGNVSAVWDDSMRRYAITITGEDYWLGDYTTQITPMCSNRKVVTRTASFLGDLIVYFYDKDDDRQVKCEFGMTTFKGL